MEYEVRLPENEENAREVVTINGWHLTVSEGTWED
jgi:hypothetical protein